MNKQYNIQGMTCNGCRKKVEDILTTTPGVTAASVNIEKSLATIEMNSVIALNIFQDRLADKYTISEKETPIHSSTSPSDHTQKTNVVKQLFPLFLIFGYIIIASLLLNYNPWSLDNFMLDFMGLFYIVFSFFKLLDLRGFPASFRMYDPIARIVPAYGWFYPFIEIGLGLLFLMRYGIKATLIITILILGITTIGVSKTLIDKKRIQCACLGTALKLPMTKATFIENTVMLAMAIWMLLH